MSASNTPHPQDGTPFDPAGLPPLTTSPRPRSDAGWGEWRSGFVIAVGCAVLGVAAAAVWLWLAPRIPLISTGHQVYMQDSEGEQTVGQDGVYIIVTAVAGLIAGAGAFLWRRRGGTAVVVLGLLVGGVLGAVVAWRLGVLMGPEQDLPTAARAAGAGKIFDAPLGLQAKSALLAWPVGAMVAHLALTAGFGPREEFEGYPLDPHAKGVGPA